MSNPEKPEGKTDQTAELSDNELDRISGGDALDAIRQAVETTPNRSTTNTMTDPFLKPQDMTSPSSLPYNPM